MTRHTDLPVLVVGGNGFIGSRITQNLVASLKWNPIVVDNQEDYGILDRTQLSKLHRLRRCTRLLESSSYDVHNISIMEFNKMETMFKKFQPHSVIHLASYPRQKVVNANPLKATGVMCDALVNMLELAVKYQVKHFMYFSSSMVYGDFNDRVDENAVCAPKGQYAIMKHMGEQLVRDYHIRHGLQYTIIRPSAVYGPLDVEDRVVSKMLLNALRGKEIQVNGPNQIYNLTASEIDARTLLDCAKIIKKIVPGTQIVINERDQSFPQRGRLNNNKINMYFENVKRTPLTTGLVAYHSWLVKNFELFNN
jgi:nucleoside-diphosphate-sugar epimerase